MVGYTYDCICFYNVCAYVYIYIYVYVYTLCIILWENIGDLTQSPKTCCWYLDVKIPILVSPKVNSEFMVDAIHLGLQIYMCVYLKNLSQKQSSLLFRFPNCFPWLFYWVFRGRKNPRPRCCFFWICACVLFRPKPGFRGGLRYRWWVDLESVWKVKSHKHLEHEILGDKKTLRMGP